MQCPSSRNSLSLSDSYAIHLQKCLKLKHHFSGKSLHAQIIKGGLFGGVYLLNNLLGFYSKTGCVADAQQLFDEMPVRTTYCWNTILSAFTQQGKLKEALDIFDQIPERDSVSWTAMIAGYNRMGWFGSAARMFLEMIWEKVPITQFTATNMIASCARIGAVDMGRKVHGVAVKSGFGGYVSVANSLLNMYSKLGDPVRAKAVFKQMRVKNRMSWNALINLHMRSGSFDAALSLFKKMDGPDAVSWNAIVSGYSRSGFDSEALAFFSDMVKHSSVNPDKFTFSSVLSSCGNLRNLGLGRRIHARIVVTDESQISASLVNSLISMYAKCGDIESASKVLNEWSSLDTVAFTAVLDGYVKLGDVGPARKIFDSLRNPDVVAWTAMIVGYSRNGLNEEALRLFRTMTTENGPKPNEYTLAAVASASSSLEHGKQIHGNAIRSGEVSSVSVSNALIAMYAEMGSINAARKVFKLTVRENNRDTVTWTSMIVSLAKHGAGGEAIEVFEAMMGRGIEPDRVTFVGVLTACAHNGLVKKGRRYYDAMRNVHGIKPELSHYGCMTDLLGRAGLVREAFDFVKSMPVEPDAETWGSLLSACRVHDEAQMAEIAAHRLLLVKPGNSGAYSTLATVYSASGRWEESARIRKSMRDMGVHKDRGLSCL